MCAYYKQDGPGIQPRSIKKLKYGIQKIACEQSNLVTLPSNILFTDLKIEVLVVDEEDLKTQLIKCPEIEIKINNVPHKDLVDTGSAINGISE